ncbi:MAG: lytic transglycosylase domain-containing protein, partial [Streptosporangiaceae bacterium]
MTWNRRPAMALALLVVLALTAVAVVVITRGTGRAPATAVPPAVPMTSPAATRVVVADQVAPLKRVVPPDVLAVVPTGVQAAQVARIRKIKKVRDVIVVDGGGVRLQGRQVNLLAVDPSQFRSWTSPSTARKQALWAALAADKLVVSGTVAKELALQPGSPYPIIARSSPEVVLGGVADLGIPGIDALVSR